MDAPGAALEEQTLETLSTAPFNKMRMCVFPKHYTFNHNEPELYPLSPAPIPPPASGPGTGRASTRPFSSTWSCASANCATWASRPT
jgi:hypothetical protein